MTVFSYTACTAEGRKIDGIIEAESAPAAARMLMERGETAVRIEERRTLRLPQETRQWLSRRGGVTDEERIAFFQELSALLAVGLPMHRALERLRDGVGESSPSGRLLHDLHHAALQGMPLSRAMETKQQIFSPVLVGMVRAGEESGSLDVVLGAAASFLTEEHRMREALWSALLYPLFLLVAVVLSIALMTVFILPIFAALLADLHADLPLPTQLLLTASAQIADAPAATVFVLLAVPLGIGLLLRIPSVRFLCDRCILRLPVVGVFIRCRAWQMILCVLAVLLRSGIRLDRAVALACTATGNRALRRQLSNIEQRLIEGRSLT
ncbi:MAG: type II secretion system F family protein, partial [Selenomonas sp.]|nr:type II secretion system F family protein [Selenomonas sp.]